MLVSVLDQKHPEYKGDAYARNDALFCGGEHLLNDAMLSRLLLMGAQEPAAHYKARKDAAFYENHCAGLVGQLRAWLFSVPPKETSKPEQDKLDPFWGKFLGNCDRNGSTLHQFRASRIQEAMLCQRAWTLVDFPRKSPAAAAPRSLADEVKAGARDAYLVALDTDAVINWERDAAGELLYVIVKDTATPQPTWQSTRGVQTISWTVWDRKGWERYEWTQKKPGDKPKLKDEAKRADGGPHSFGVVPIIEECLEDGFFLLGHTWSLFREKFNVDNGLSWANRQGLYPPVIFKATQNTNLAAGKIAQTGYGWTIGEKEDAFYLQPAVEAFKYGLERVKYLLGEIHRVMHQMALSANSDAGTMQRSGDSKDSDKEATEIVLQEFSQFEVKGRASTLRLVAQGRKEKIEWDVAPVPKFSITNAAERLDQVLTAGTLGIKSKTFEKARQKEGVRALLPDLPEETLEEIDSEIDEAVDADPEGHKAEVAGGMERPNPDETARGDARGSEGGDGSGDGGKGDAARAQRTANGEGGGKAQRRGSSQARTSG
jgi:hypothetical protein